jgi:hypothetical protein
MAYHEPLQELIELATRDIEAEGYMHAEPNSVQLALFGYLVRENRRQQAELVQQITEVLDARLTEQETRSPRELAKQHAPTAGIVGVVMVIAETIRAFVLGG